MSSSHPPSKPARLPASSRLRTQLSQLQDAFHRSASGLDQLADLIEEQERLATFGGMAAGMVHEINNAITPLVACASLLDEEEGSKNHELVELIQTAAVHANDVLHQFRFFFGQESDVSRQPVQLHKVVERAIQLTRFRWRNEAQQRAVSYQVTANVKPDLEVDGNTTDYTQLLINLLLNAIEAMPQGGQIDISARSLDDSIEVSVSDQGVGLGAEGLGNEFTPFFTTKQSGSGLGLVACQRIAERHGGRIRVEPNTGGGTCFLVSLPRSDRRSSTDAVSAKAILVVDSDHTTRQIKLWMLEEFGLTVDTALDRAESVQRVREKAYRVVLLDVADALPNVASWVEELKTASPSTAVVFVTGWPKREVLRRFRDLDATPDQIVEKPFGKEEIRKSLSELMKE